MGWMFGVLGFDSQWEARIFLFTIAPRTVLGPTQPPIQWVPGALSLGVNQSGREADHSHPSSAEVKECVELYIHSPNTPSRCDAQFKKAQEQLYFIGMHFTSAHAWNKAVLWRLVFRPCASTEHHAMKTYRGSGRIAPRILDLGTKWKWVISFTSRPLYREGRSPPVSIG
jgi:hypothetical protein